MTEKYRYTCQIFLVHELEEKLNWMGKCGWRVIKISERFPSHKHGGQVVEVIFENYDV